MIPSSIISSIIMFIKKKKPSLNISKLLEYQCVSQIVYEKIMQIKQKKKKKKKKQDCCAIEKVTQRDIYHQETVNRSTDNKFKSDFENEKKSGKSKLKYKNN